MRLALAFWFASSFAWGADLSLCPRKLGEPAIDLYVRKLPEVEGIQGPLSWEERTVASRFVSVTRQREYVGARIVLREILAGYLALSADQVPLVVPHGALSQKPFVAANPPLSFNMSHSRGHIAVAVWLGRRGHEIGVDLEKLRPIDDLPALAARYFNDAETGLILRADNREDEFLRFWTLKEAYVKALSTGLVGNVRDLSTLERPDAWMESFPVAQGFRVAVAVTPKPDAPPRLQLQTQ